MPVLPTHSQLAQLAALPDDPQARLFLELAASGYDSDQIRQARCAGPNSVLLPERSATTQALAELAHVVGEANAQGVREAGIRAFAAHNGEQPLGSGWTGSPVHPQSPGSPPEDERGAR